MKKKYYYNGPVFRFGRSYIGDWKATTMAVSPAKALANLCYRYKVEHNLMPNSSLRLDPKYIREISEPVVTVNKVVANEYHQMTIFELLEA